MQLDLAMLEETVGGDDAWMARPFDRVPDHLLVSVLRHLNVRERLLAEFVCRRWRRLALDAAWTHTRAVDYGSLFKDGSLSPARLFYQNGIHSWAASLEKAENKRKRQAIGLLEAVVERADLRELNFSSFRDSIYSVNTFIEPTVVSRVCSLCPTLTTLNVSRVPLTTSALCTIGAQLGGRLRSLDLSGCFGSTDIEPGLGRLFADCAKLECLGLSNNWGVTGTNSFALLPVTLASLNVARCRALTDAALRNVAERCGALEELKMAGQFVLSPAAIQQYLSRLGSLRSLNFCDYDPDIENNYELFTAVGSLANLQRLELGNNRLVSDQTLMALAHGCKKLHTLSLMYGKHDLTDAGIGALARLPNLTRLKLFCIESVTDAPLIAIAEGGKLKVLIVHGCPFVTDAALQRVASCCEGLRHLEATDCPLVSDATLLALLELVQRRATADSLHVRLHQTAVTQPVIVAHPNLSVNFDCNWGLRYILECLRES